MSFRSTVRVRGLSAWGAMLRDPSFNTRVSSFFTWASAERHTYSYIFKWRLNTLRQTLRFLCALSDPLPFACPVSQGRKLWSRWCWCRWEANTERSESGFSLADRLTCCALCSASEPYTAEPMYLFVKKNNQAPRHSKQIGNINFTYIWFLKLLW